jgi:hypothetical protein
MATVKDRDHQYERKLMRIISKLHVYFKQKFIMQSRHV